MTESIEKTLEAISPYLRRELRSYGYSDESPGVDDLLQEAHLRLWKALEAREGGIIFLNSYAKKVVFTVFINEVNRIQRERRLMRRAENRLRIESTGGGCRPEGIDFLRETVLDSVSRLSRNHRLVIELCLEGLPLDEIARLQGWRLSKVRNCYRRGIHELRRRLSIRGNLP